MKPTKTLLTGLCTLAIGIVLIICNSLITSSGIVTVAGLLFLVIGVVNLILYVTQKDEEGKKRTRGLALVLGWLVSVSSIILGLCMLIFNDTFNQMVPLIFGLLVFFGAVMSALALGVIVRKYVKMHGAIWAMPGVMLVLAIIIAMQSVGADGDHIIMILTGVAMVIFAIQCFIVSSITAAANRKAEREASVTQDKDRQNDAVVEAKNIKELKALDD